MYVLTDFSPGFVVVLVELEVLAAADEDLVGEEQRGRVDDRRHVHSTEQLQAEANGGCR